jgi:hypothetical protein
MTVEKSGSEEHACGLDCERGMTSVLPAAQPHDNAAGPRFRGHLRPDIDRFALMLKESVALVYASVRTALQERRAPEHPISWIWPVLTIAIIAWHYWPYMAAPLTRPEELRDAPRVSGSTSIHDPYLYDYGVRYWGLLPAYSTYVEANRSDSSLFTEDMAERVLIERGNTIQMRSFTLQCGERMVKAMKYPLSLITPRDQPLSHKSVMGGCFVLGLAIMTLSLWRYAPFPLCVFLPLMLCSSTFIAGDIFWGGKTLTTPIIGAIYTIALLAPVVFDRELRTRSLLLRMAALSAAVVFLMGIRNTVLPVMGAALLIILSYRRRPIWMRVLLGVCLLLFYAGFSKRFDRWWDQTYEETHSAVEAVGGIPYRGTLQSHHQVWHPIFVGLADFDTKYGVRWADGQAWSLAARDMKAAGMEIEAGTEGHAARDSRYPDLIRARTIKMIRQDPKWYATILLKRIQKILWENEDPKLNTGIACFSLPLTPLLFTALLLLLLLFRAHGHMKTLIVAATTATVPLLCTTYINRQLISVVHLVAAAIALTIVYRLLASFTKLLVTRVKLLTTRVLKRWPLRGWRGEDPEVLAVVVIVLLFIAALIAFKPNSKLIARAVVAAEAKQKEYVAWVAEHPLYDGLQVGLTFDGTLANTASQEFSITGKSISFVNDGQFGGACRIGKGSRMAVANLHVGAEGTWALWARMSRNADVNSEMRILDTNGNLMMVRGGRLSAGLQILGNKGVHAELPARGEWFHVAVSWGGGDHGAMRLYVNGLEVDSSLYSAVPQTVTCTLNVGVAHFGKHEFAGEIDELCIFDRCLNSIELAALMRMGLVEAKKNAHSAGEPTRD